ncbi:hypothetical protein Tco_1243357 [Tanacetum coccineum]
MFTYEVEIPELANIPRNLKEEDDLEQRMAHGSDDGLEYDPSNVEFTEWLGSKFYNHGTMDWYTKNALWIYSARGDDEVELTDEETSDSDDNDEVAIIFRIETNVFDYETPSCNAFNEFNYLLQIDLDVLTKDNEGFKTYEEYKDDWIYEWNKDVPWPFNYKSGCSEWPTCSWREDGYCNGENLPGTYIVGNSLHYQDLEWYEALEDGELKVEALKNKAIMEGIIEEDDESSNEGRCELFDDHELPVFNIRKFEMIKYSFGDDEKYVSIKEDKYDDLTSTEIGFCMFFQYIAHDLTAKKSTKLVKYQSSGILLIMEYLVKISKKARILELKRRHLKITVLTPNTPTIRLTLSLLVIDTLLTKEATFDQDKMDDPDITMKEYIRLEEEKAHRLGQVYNWETSIYGKIWYDEDVYYLRSFEKEFAAIVYNDALTSGLEESSDFENEFPAIVNNDALATNHKI